MAGGKNACEAVIHTVNLSAFKNASRNVPLSKCLLIAPCKTTRLPPCVNKNIPAIPHCPPCVPLRLCNPIETRNVCKQESCYCRPKLPPMTASQKLGYTFGFALKCGVIVGLIWITNEQGFWSGHHEITCLYGRIMRRIQSWTSLDVGPKAGEYPEIWPDLTREKIKNYFDNQKLYEPILLYDCTFNASRSWDQKSARSDRRKREGESHDRIYKEEEDKTVPVLTSFWYGRPSLPFLDMLSKGFTRRDQGRVVMRRNGVNLNAENELQPST